jgi:hypothetical protein
MNLLQQLIINKIEDKDILPILLNKENEEELSKLLIQNMQ